MKDTCKTAKIWLNWGIGEEYKNKLDKHILIKKEWKQNPISPILKYLKLKIVENASGTTTVLKSSQQFILKATAQTSPNCWMDLYLFLM